jgi:hypothetical protein
MATLAFNTLYARVGQKSGSEYRQYGLILQQVANRRSGRRTAFSCECQCHLVLHCSIKLTILIISYLCQIYKSRCCTATSKSHRWNQLPSSSRNTATAGCTTRPAVDMSTWTISSKHSQGGTCSRTGARIDMKRTLLSAGRRRDLDGGRAADALAGTRSSQPYRVGSGRGRRPASVCWAGHGAWGLDRKRCRTSSASHRSVQASGGQPHHHKRAPHPPRADARNARSRPEFRLPFCRAG